MKWNFRKDRVVLILIVGLTSVTIMISQNSQLPPGEPGKCYAKALISDQPYVKTVTYPIYVGNEPEKVKLKKVRHCIKTGPHEWVKRRVENCQSADPNDCLIWCLVENEPPEYVDLLVAKKPKKLDPSEIEYRTFQTTKISKGGVRWKEVLCSVQITPEIIRGLQVALKMEGYELVITETFDEETKTVLKNYQRDYHLPIGNLNLETLDSLGIYY